MGLSLSDMDRDGKERAKKAAIMVDGEIKEPDNKIKTGEIFPASDYKRLRPTGAGLNQSFSGGTTLGELSVMILSLEERIEELEQKPTGDVVSLAAIAKEHADWVHGMGYGNLPVLDALKGISGEVTEAAAEIASGVLFTDGLVDELADIILRTLTLFIELGIDPEKAITDKMKLNQKRVKK